MAKRSAAQSAARREFTSRYRGESVVRWRKGSKYARIVRGAKLPPMTTTAEGATTSAFGSHSLSRKTRGARRRDFQKSDRAHRMRVAAAHGMTMKPGYSLVRSGTSFSGVKSRG